MSEQIDARDFYSLMMSESSSPGERTWQVPDQWQQGRGAFGGLVVGALVRALEDERVDLEGSAEQSLRSLTATLCGPVMPGPAQLKIEALRVGSGTSTFAISIIQEDELRAHAVALFGRARMASGGTWQDEPVPPLSDWRALDVIPIGPPLGPVFARHFEYRPVGLLPFGGPTQPRQAQGWIRARHPGATRDAAYLAGLIDCWWPATYTSMSQPRPMATVTYTLEIIDQWGEVALDESLFYSAHAPVSTDGYTVEFRQLWSPDGRLLALNQQTIAIIK